MPEEITISGYSGRFPNCPNMEAFYQMLYGGADFVGPPRRYPANYYELPNRAGHLLEIDKFDASFFSMTKAHVDSLDPQIRLLLELSVEALFDAGLSLKQVAGTDMGVYACIGFNDFFCLSTRNVSTITGNENVGGALTMSANRVSSALDVHGPSVTFDTACSSSLTAFDHAVNDILRGRCSRAIVAASALDLNPAINKSFSKYNMLSPDGTCYSFDVRANGYCRSEAAAVIILEGKSVRPTGGYADVVGSSTNCNGYTPEGITYPSVSAQIQLIKSTLSQMKESASIEYVEAHGTGTTAGDNIEINALDTVYGRKGDTVILGSIKSNMGHSETASGLMSIIKVLAAYETGKIAPNLHFTETKHLPILENRFMVPTSPLSWNCGYTAVNNFGFGGTNCHIILKKGTYVYKEPNSQKYYTMGRDKETLIQQELPRNILKGSRHKYRYRAVVTSNNDAAVVSEVKVHNPKLAVVFSGQGSNWNGMARDLIIENSVFRSTIERLSSYLPNDVNLVEMFEKGDMWLQRNYSTLGICAVEIGLFNILKEKGINPDFYIGHSMGEILCGYADNCLTESETIQVAYIRSKITELLDFDCKLVMTPSDVKIDEHFLFSYGKYSTYSVPKSRLDNYSQYTITSVEGMMAVIGAPVEFVEKYIADCKNTVIACFNSLSGLTLSGPTEEINEVIKNIKNDNPEVFVRKINTDGVAYHSPMLKPLREFLFEHFNNLLTRDCSFYKRTKSWISTSSNYEFCDSTYQVQNIILPVYFYQAINQLPQGTVVLEIGPTKGLLAQIKRIRSDVVPIASLIPNEPSKECLSQMFDNLWLSDVMSSEGCDVSDSFQYSYQFRYKHLWSHSKSWNIPDWRSFEQNNGKVEKFNCEADYSFLLDHVIDKRPLFPATGYLYAIWKQIGLHKAIAIRDFKILRAIPLENSLQICLNVNLQQTGVNILYCDELVATAKVDECKLTANQISDIPLTEYLTKSDVYNNFKRYGYEYKTDFQLISYKSLDGKTVKFSKPKHWICYLDNLLQCFLHNASNLLLPVGIKEVNLHPASSISDVGLDVEYDPFIKTVSSSHVKIRDLQTGIAYLQSGDKLTLSQQQWIPFGIETFSEPQLTEEEHKLASILLSIINKISLKSFPWVEKIQILFKENNYSNSYVLNGHPLGNIIRDLLSPVENLEKYLSNPAELLENHSSYNVLFENSSSFCCPDDIYDKVFGILNNEISYPNILEIGSGTCAFTKKVIKYLQNFNTFHVTDSNEKFMVSELDQDARIAKFVYDANKPFTRDAKYTLAVASHSIHTVSDINKTLGYLFNTLEDEGFLLIEERVDPLPVLVWGLNSELWSTPSDSRNYGLWLSVDEWLTRIQNARFKLVKVFKSEKKIIVLAKKCQIDQDVPIVTKWEEVKIDRRQIVLGESGMEGFCRSLRNEHINAISYDGSKIIGAELALNVNVVKNEIHGTNITLPFNIRKEISPKNFRLTIEKIGDLSSLRYVQDRPRSVNISYAALNFKDVMYAYGKLKLLRHAIGFEWSGVRDNVRLMGFSNTQSCIAGSIDPTDLTWTVPDNLTLEQAATIPVVYSTVYCALFYKSRLRRGDWVLIHSGAGGVGHAAIHLCLSRGINVLTTSSFEKKHYLMSTFGLHESQIGNSRSLDFREWVLRKTEGRGVKCVLNSLAGEKLQASLECVSKFGHMAEIGKYDIEQGTNISLKCLEYNVSFHVIDLSEIFYNDDMLREIKEMVNHGLQVGEVKPLPTKVFLRNELENAMRYMSKGEHIGKIVINMNCSNPISIEPRFHTSGVHIITGGLGGFGLEVAIWLAGNGAERVVLTSRSGVKTGWQKYRLEKLKGMINVDISHLDVRKEDQCVRLLNLYSNVKGIWHAAAIFEDCMFENMTAEKWSMVSDIKLSGCKYLDLHSRKLSLDAFVFFSSVSSLIGNPGQSNYAFANNACEHICMKRWELGLPALAIQWGALDNIGYFTQNIDKMNTSSLSSVFNIKPQNVDASLQSLHKLLFSSSPVAAAYVRPSKTVQKHSTSFRDWLVGLLGISADQINVEMTFQEYGLDSLQSVEVQSKLKSFHIQKHSNQIGGMKIKEVWNI